MPAAKARASVAIAAAVTVATTFPISFVGVIAPAAGLELHFGPQVVGLIAAAYWASSSAVALSAGRLVRSVSPRALMLLTVLLATVSLVGSAVLTPTWHFLIVWAAVGGASNALGHPSSNSLIIRHVRQAGRALAFGVKQAAIPIASVITGASLPLIVAAFGWRWAFAPASVLCLLLLLWIRGLAQDPRHTRGAVHARARLPRAAMPFLLTVGATTLIGSFQSNAMGAFIVSGAHQVGISSSGSGVLLLVASLTAAGMRTFAGWIVGRSHGKALLAVAVLMLSGAGGLALMSGPASWQFVVGGIIAFAGAYGWPGLIHFVVSDAMGAATPGATLLTQSGSYIGSTFGPVLFGLLFAVSPTNTWLVMSGCAAVAAVVALAAHRRFRQYMQFPPAER